MKKTCAVLLIHGFGGSTKEVLPLYATLRANKLPVYTVQLAGHTGKYWDFFSTTRKDWISSVEKKTVELLTQYDNLILVGFSMGGLIATYMMDYPVRGIIFANTPLYFCDFGQVVRNFELAFWQYTRKYTSAAVRTPPKALTELYALLAETKDVGFAKVRCPALILQTRDDDTAHYKSAQAIASRVRGLKRVILYPRGGHKIFAGSMGESACKDALAFIKATYQSINRETLG